MSGRKNSLSSFQIITSEAMSADITSEVTSIAFLDNIGIQLNATGNPEGTAYIEVSADYEQDSLGNVLNAGNWVALATSASFVGDPDNVYFDLNQLSAPWIRTSYTNTFVETGSITAVADSSGSLNSKYFLINGADGDNWYIWFDVNSAGVNPNVPSRTGIAVALATNASANTVGAAVRTALASVTSVETIGGSNQFATFAQTEPGAGSLTDGGAPTGFTFSYVANIGVLNAFITAKQL